MQLYINLTEIISVMAIGASFIGVIIFLLLYRPFNPRKHGRMGAHLIHMFWALGLVFGTSLLAILVDPYIHPAVAGTINAVLLSYVAFVVWQRVDLYRDFKNGEFDAPEPPAKVE